MARKSSCVTELGDKMSEALCGTHHFHKAHPQLSTHSLLRADAYLFTEGKAEAWNRRAHCCGLPSLGTGRDKGWIWRAIAHLVQFPQ